MADEMSRLVAAVHELDVRGLNRGSSGNCSIRLSTQSFLITPSGVPSRDVTLDQLVSLSIEGTEPEQSSIRPSSEWRFHRDIYRQRCDVGAVVHVHSHFATSLSCMRRNIPSFHYMVAVAGGTDIRCAPYATYGTESLSEKVLQALSDRQACLLANHGMIAVGRNLAEAVSLCIEVESLAQQYVTCLSLGEPTLLTDEEMQQVLAKFPTYRSHRSF